MNRFPPLELLTSCVSIYNLLKIFLGAYILAVIVITVIVEVLIEGRIKEC